jgi:hypothetical protein
MRDFLKSYNSLVSLQDSVVQTLSEVTQYTLIQNASSI